ncbi:MAG: tRNA-dihydrouridine synthase family protein [Verrucomicrobia bacterium]|nr:tRNA-dihydrouridine synthase family protein [Verrucomicrobiota bacterium]
MFDQCVLRGRRFAPARFCAPLAGYTHSAFRRLLADWGGTGAVWTEMLAARQLLREDFAASPWLRRRPTESCVIYQLMVRGGDMLERILDRLGEHGADGVDLNLACDAVSIRACEAGSALFEDLPALRGVLEAARRFWPGLLTAKIRLGSRRPDWQARFRERLRALEEAGVDALVLHPRFFEDKFKRRAQHELIPWAASLTRLPLIANGDLANAAQASALAGHLAPACGLMIGRMTIAQPWLFAAWDRPLAVDLPAVWHRLYQYVLEDFPPAVALRRIQMFSKYFAANFAFGHAFYVALSTAPNLGELRARAADFFARSPAILAHPIVAGL